MKFFKIKLVILLFFITSSLSAQRVNKSQLTIQQIMQGHEYVGQLPERAYWHPDGTMFYFRWNKKADSEKKWYSYTLATKTLNELTDDDELKRIPQYYELSVDKKKGVL